MRAFFFAWTILCIYLLPINRFQNPRALTLPLIALEISVWPQTSSPQFGGYSAESLSDRMLDAEARVLITADAVWRGAKLIHLKEIADDGELARREWLLSVWFCVTMNQLQWCLFGIVIIFAIVDIIIGIIAKTANFYDNYYCCYWAIFPSPSFFSFVLQTFLIYFPIYIFSCFPSQSLIILLDLIYFILFFIYLLLLLFSFFLLLLLLILPLFLLSTTSPTSTSPTSTTISTNYFY